METRRFFLIFLGLWLALSMAGTFAFAGWGKKKKSPEVPENKYAYSAKDKENTRFFPVEEARWNGYEVTAADWDQLSDFLKARFMRDARTELETREKSVILVNDMDRLVKAMDSSMKVLQADPKLRGMPVINFFHLMLLRNDAIKKAWVLAKPVAPKATPQESVSKRR